MKTCFNYQVLAVVLYQQLQVAYRASDAEEQFDTWTNMKCQDSCWHMGLELLLKYLMFVRAFRVVKSIPTSGIPDPGISR